MKERRELPDSYNELVDCEITGELEPRLYHPRHAAPPRLVRVLFRSGLGHDDGRVARLTGATADRAGFTQRG